MSRQRWGFKGKFSLTIGHLDLSLCNMRQIWLPPSLFGCSQLSGCHDEISTNGFAAKILE
jgi:hypothetical protein